MPKCGYVSFVDVVHSNDETTITANSDGATTNLQQQIVDRREHKAQLIKSANKLNFNVQYYLYVRLVQTKDPFLHT